jgi:hypothetical protein
MRPGPLAGIAVLVAVVALTTLREPSRAESGAFGLHVRVDGSDTVCTGYVDGPASEAPDCAFATIAKAIETAPAGGQITIGPGDFSANQLDLARDVTMKGGPGPRPVLRTPHLAYGLNCEAGVRCTFTHLEFAGGDDFNVAIGIEGTGVVSDSVFRGIGRHAVGVTGALELTNSRFDGVAVAVATLGSS